MSASQRHHIRLYFQAHPSQLGPAYGCLVPVQIYNCLILCSNFFFCLQAQETAANDTGPYEEYELFYRHSSTMTAVYCVAYFVVFIVGLIGNSFVIAVVFRAPRMRTVTNFFIVNLAVADVLVIVFCLPATLMSNIFVRKYTTIPTNFIMLDT